MATVMVDASTAISMRGLPAFHQPAGFISAAREGAAVTLVTRFSAFLDRIPVPAGRSESARSPH
ncbi:hypothetical protein MPL1032_20557 [Mesorhizobium plurifarium]|uniref:Uncharacterized protein n=1 Tax=Mesorhizobium plurifarium TaxID=69974 RepID=A0A0K2VXZ4_MESPL|nr:hypothetical protein MPL1032_20557 [Mesorhizobium plurifarium]